MQFVRLLLILAVAVAGLLAMPARATPLLLVDAQSGEILYEQDAGQKWHPASLTKLMTAYVAFAAIAQGRISLDTPIRISRNAWNQAPSKSGLEIDSTITMQDALYILVVKSANDIAVAIAEAVSGSVEQFVAEMNGMAAAMGLTATHYVNPHGLHHAAQVTSARDLAVLALYIRRDFPQYLPMFGTEVVTLGKASLESNNSLLEHFAGTTGMKTGYVCASGLNIVATVERQGRSLLGVVLGGSSARERNEMTAELFLRGLSGAVRGTGKSVVALPNTDAEPVNMRPLICGKQAKEYARQREAAFPMGLKGQPSYLTDQIEGAAYTATDLGRRRNVPLPRPRPSFAPVVAASY
ncbi:MAG: D-alanyl-D-alanine carboxypeptidase family protein [Thiobacillus sp.]|uniref:D-alanyl-D-alanine carboxypeptidase family protein n=1 Tax=Thiobacillus sp. TaxID=924 RepID=UPI0028948304|nr:D-alanyl-D-alanine carboxypeptidase family protein [Thiobacillus sp.]MDT3707404.1 D-alanyl-D-alanine carboxypeptidase family protein [Thiobacillus sp.]